MKLSETYLEALRISDSQVELLPADGRVDISQFSRAILFVLAEWSMSSVWSFKMLNCVLGEFSGNMMLRLLIANTDSEATQSFFFERGDVPAGNGEVYWIRDGVVIGNVHSATDTTIEEVTRLTRRLVRGR